VLQRDETPQSQIHPNEGAAVQVETSTEGETSSVRVEIAGG
jgi:hypothetical protein